MKDAAADVQLMLTRNPIADGSPIKPGGQKSSGATTFAGHSTVR